MSKEKQSQTKSNVESNASLNNDVGELDLYESVSDSSYEESGVFHVYQDALYCPEDINSLQTNEPESLDMNYNYAGLSIPLPLQIAMGVDKDKKENAEMLKYTEKFFNKDKNGNAEGYVERLQKERQLRESGSWGRSFADI